MDPADIGVQCNLGSDWFTSLRQGVAYDAAQHTVTFRAKQSNFAANDKIFLQGDKALISEPGEWALESSSGMLYLWPRDEAAMAAGRAEVVAADFDDLCRSERHRGAAGSAPAFPSHDDGPMRWRSACRGSAAPACG